MKQFVLLILFSALITPVFAQQEIGGSRDVSLQISSNIVRKTSSSSVPAFNFQSGTVTWNGSEINSTTETVDFVDRDAVESCAQAALDQSSSSCYYQDFYTDYYSCPGADWWRTCWTEYMYWRQIPGCTDALQEQIVQQLDDGTHPCIAANTDSYPLARNNHFVLVELGIDYTLDISNLADTNISTSLLAPPGYLIFFENGSGDYEPATRIEADFDTAITSVTFQIRELRTDAPALFGQSGNILLGDIKWELGVGALGNGDSAGRLVIHEKDLTDVIYTREAIKFYQPITAGPNELEVIEDGSGYLRQIRTPSSFVDLVDTVTDAGKVIQYEIRLYAPLASGAIKTGGVYSPNSSDLLITYAIGRTAAEDLTDFFVKQYNASGTLLRSDDLDKAAVGTLANGVPLNNWLVTTTASSGAHAVNKTVLVQNFEYTQGGVGTGLRQEQVLVGQTKRLYDEEDYNFLSDSIYSYVPDQGLGALGELKLFQGRLDNSSGGFNYGNGGKGFNYIYNLSTSAPESYGRRTLSIDAFGGWTFVNFNDVEDSLDYGEENLIIRPGDSPYDPTKFTNGVFVDHDNDPVTSDILEWNADLIAANDNARYTTTSRVYDYDGVTIRDAGTQEYLNDAGISALTPFMEAVNYPTFGDYGSEKIEVVCSYKPHDFPKTSNRRNARFTAKYTPNTSNPRLIGKPIFVFNPDHTKTSYGYFEGSYRGLSDAFVVIEISGYNSTALPFSDAGDQTIDDQVHGSTNVSHEGMNFTVDAVTLASGQSTKLVTVRDEAGRVRYIERWAYTTSSEWKKIEDVVQSFNKYGQLESRTLNGRTVYEANWVGIRKEWEKDEAGIKTTFEYDGIGRVTALTVDGVSGVNGIPEQRKTNFYYDARDRVVVTETVVSGSEKLIDKKLFDAEGYLLSETDANGLTTDYKYEYENNGSTFIGLKKTASYPDDTYRITYIKQNGEFWKDVLYASDDSVIEENLYAFSDNAAAPAGSGLESTNRKVRIDYRGEDGVTADDPYVERYYDASGRIRFEETPSAVAGSPFQKVYEYDATTGQLVAEFETEVAEGATAGSLGLRRIKEYGDMGEVTVHGIDVNDDGSLTSGSPDRLKESTERFVLEGSNVWLETTRTVYPEDGEDNPFETTSMTQLNGLPTSTISIAKSEDLAGNEITTTTSVNRTSNTITTAVDYPDSDTDETTVVQNGFTKSVTSKENLTTTFGYDQAGRQILAKNPRSISSVTKYEANKDRVEYLITGVTSTVTGSEDIAALSPLGYVTQSAYDATTGRQLWEKNPDGNYTRFSYNDRGLVEKRWGEATYPVWLEYDGFGQLEKQHTFGMANVGAGADFTGSEWPSNAGTGDVTTFDYFDSVGLLKSRTDALSRETSFTYDARGRVVTEVSPDGGVNDPSITITRTYFTKTDELKSIDYTGDSDLTPDLDFTYYRSGAINSVSEDGVTRTFHYDFTSTAANESDLKLLAEDLPSYYTAISDRSVSDSGHRHNRIRYDYQSGGNMPSRLESVSMGTAATGSDLTLASTRYSTSYDYDSKGRLDEVDVAPSRTWTYSYFANTNQIGGRTLSGTSLETARSYESDRNLLSSIETSDDVTSVARFAYRYNDLGNREDVVQTGTAYGIYDQGLVIDFGYNDRQEVTRFDSVTGSNASVLEGSPILMSGRSFAFDYDDLGNRSSITHRNVKLSDNTVTDREFTWSANALNQLDSRNNADFVHIQGRSELETFVTVGLVPDDLHRAVRYGEFFSRAFELRDGTSPAIYRTDLDLFSVEPDGWIDPNDGTTVLGDLIDHQQREVWLPPATESFTYDVRGNLKTDSCWDYTWDGANRLRFVETSSTAAALGVSREKFGYRYDYLGRRVAKDVYTWTGSAYASDPSESTLYYYDGWNLIYEATYTGITYSGGNPIAATFESEVAYTWGLDWSTSLQGAGGVGGLVAIAFREAGGTSEIRYPGFDGNGNLVVLLDESGNLTATYEYGPYGELWRASGPDAARNPFRFSTKYHDTETKLYYYGYRYYSPDYGRFISQDPIRENGGLNIYAFVNNNPTNYYDYLGMFFDFGGAFDSAAGYVDSFIPDINFQTEISTNFETGVTTGGWALQVPTYDFGVAYYDYGGMSEFTARTTSSIGSNWSYDLRMLNTGSFKYEFNYSYNPGLFSYSYGDYGSDAFSFSFGDTYIREIEMPEYNLWSAAAEGLGQGGYEVAMSFRRVAEGMGTTAGYLWYEPVDTVLGMHDQITTNLADGYFLIKDTTWSDVGRDIVSFGDLYVNDAEFRGGITDIFTDSAVGLATGSSFLNLRSAPDEYVTVYRGVHSQHPDLPNALQGRANPIGGHSDPILHNQGFNDSVFTSWTTDYGTALDFAFGKYSGFDDAGGVILQQQVRRSDLVNSPDAMGEFEVLRVGPITGAQPIIISK